MSQDLPVIHLQNDHMMVCPGNTVNPLTGHRIEGSSISSSYAQDNPLTGHRKKRRIERRVTIGCPLTGHRRKCSVITQETNENGLHRGGGGQSGGSGSGGGDSGPGAGRGGGGDEGGSGNLDDKMLSTFLRTTANVDKSMTEIAAGDGGLLSEPIYLSANDQDYTPSSMRVNRGLDSVQSLDTFTSFGPIPFVDKVRAKSDRDLDYQQISTDSRLTLNSSGSSMQPENVTVQCQEESSVRSNVNKNEANTPMDLEDSDNSTAMETAPSHSRRSSISIERGAIPVVLRNTSTPIKEYSTSSKYSVESLEPVPLESLSVESLEQQKHFISAQHSPNKALKENVGSSLMQTKALIRSFSCRLKQSLRRSKSNLESSIGAKLKDTKTSLHSIRLTPSSSPANNSGYKRSKLYSNNSADNIFHKSVSSHQSEKQWRHSFLCYSKSSVSRDNNNATTTTTTRKPYFNLLAANRMMKNTSSSEDILKGKENHKRFILHANSNLECSNMKEPTILSSITCLDTSRTSSICNVSCNDENQDDSGIRHSKCKLNAPELTIKRLEDKPSGMGTGHEKKISQGKMADGLKNNVKTATSNNDAASDSRTMGNSESNQNRTKPILKSNLHRQNRVWKRSSKKRTINDTGSVSSDDNDHGVATKMAAAAASIVSTVTTASLTIANMATKAEISVIPRESPSHYYNNELHIQTLTPECSRYLLPNDCNRQGRLELTTFTGKNKDGSSASITASKCVTEDVTNTKGNKSNGGSSSGSSDSSSIFLSQTTSNCDEMEVKYENTSPPPPPSPTTTAAPLALSSPSPPLPPLALHYDTCDVVSPKYHRVHQQESGNDTGTTLQFPSPQQISIEGDAMEEDNYSSNGSSTTNNSSTTNSSNNNNNNSSINHDVSAAEAKLPTFELLLQEIVKHHHQQTNDNNNYDNYNQRHSN